LNTEELKNRFEYHPPTSRFVADQHSYVRTALHSVANMLNGTLPDGREKALAITKLEEAMFWANAALARGN
jgi:hypothetical protein